MPEVSVWAPHAARLRIAIGPGEAVEPLEKAVLTRDLKQAEDGWWRADIAESLPGRDYGFLLDDDEQVLPDPRSRRQPHGVHAMSRFYADDFAWTDAGWPGHGLADCVIY